jgi:alanine racemase
VQRFPSAWLDVDVDAIVANWRTLRALCTPGRCGAVVKADAYGLGAAAVCEHLARAGCREFFVARADEAASLAPLPALRGATLYVLEGVRAATATLLAALPGCVPVLNDAAQVARWSALAGRLGRRLPAVLHVDTGMSRLGLDEDAVAMLAANPSRLAGIDLRLLLTHLAAADVHDCPLTAAQVARFAAARAHFPGLPVSIGNSAGTLLGAATRGDVARPGIALYGGNPFDDGTPNPMREVVRLHAEILQLRDVDAGATVGYGGAFVAPRRLRVATIGCGYADGYPRALGNRGDVLVAGHRCAVVGRVSMDLLTADVTAVPPADVRVGGHATLLGGHITLEAIAAAAGTISYEVLTGFGAHVPRRLHTHVPPAPAS